MKRNLASMILVLDPAVPATRRNRIRARIEKLGLSVRHVDGGECSYLEVTGDDLPLRTLSPQNWEGVVSAVPLTTSHPHVSWGGGRGDVALPTVVSVGEGVSIGGGEFAVMAGPCAVEDPDCALSIARHVAGSGAVIYRGGAYKPRTSPYAFQGLEEEGLSILESVRSETGLLIVTEVLDTRLIERVAATADILQVGSRNMQNYALLKELGKIRKPVLLKRGFAATIDELLLSAEYILSGGNDQVILCERGIRSAAGGNQVILDLGSIPEIRRRSHLPIIVDPSHASGYAERVIPLARAAVAAGADGLLVEVHVDPDNALSDGRQALSPAGFQQLMTETRAVREALAPLAESAPEKKSPEAKSPEVGSPDERASQPRNLGHASAGTE